MIMKNPLNVQQLTDFYEQHLKETILPFWLERGIDTEDGGYFTCFDNAGEKLISHDKYTWSQGRMVWVLSRLSSIQNDIFTASEREKFLELAGRGTEFLMRNCLLENGNCTFIMDRMGRPKTYDKYDKNGEINVEYDTSIFADCFVVCGLARYAQVSGDRQALDFCVKLYKSIIGRIDSGIYKMNPYPVPEGYKFHGIPMMILYMSQELKDVLGSIGTGGGDTSASANTADSGSGDSGNRAGTDSGSTGGSDPAGMDSLLDDRIKKCLDDITGNFIRDDYTLLEMIGTDNKEKDSLLGRYINPGHSIEDMWFVINSAKSMNRPELIDIACRVAKKAADIGWDEEYGGLLLFADKAGGRPMGSTAGIEDSPMLQKVSMDWDSKLWWPHSEALYTTLLCYRHTQDQAYLDLYWKMHDYTFRTFPSPDRSIGEWIQIRDRRGEPASKVVALPVKDPFHIARNIILVLELLNCFGAS